MKTINDLAKHESRTPKSLQPIYLSRSIRFMNCRIRQFAVGGLALWLVALSGIVYPQLTVHMAQHEHHNAATHATALCSWLCIAADAVEGTVVDVAPVRYSTFLEQTFPVTRLYPAHGSQPPSRASPLL